MSSPDTTRATTKRPALTPKAVLELVRELGLMGVAPLHEATSSEVAVMWDRRAARLGLGAPGLLVLGHDIVFEASCRTVRVPDAAGVFALLRDAFHPRPEAAPGVW